MGEREFPRITDNILAKYLADFKGAAKNSSCVVDENGEPMVVYHGTNAEFNAFEGGAFFTDDYMNADGYANGERVLECFLDIKNPLVVDCGGRKWDELDTPYGKTTRAVVASEEAKKHGGVVFKNVKDSWTDDAEEQESGTVFYVRNSAQAKSATDNTGAFDDFGFAHPFRDRAADEIIKSKFDPRTPTKLVDSMNPVQRKKHLGLHRFLDLHDDQYPALHFYLSHHHAIFPGLSRNDQLEDYIRNLPNDDKMFLLGKKTRKHGDSSLVVRDYLNQFRGPADDWQDSDIMSAQDLAEQALQERHAYRVWKNKGGLTPEEERELDYYNNFIAQGHTPEEYDQHLRDLMLDEGDPKFSRGGVNVKSGTVDTSNVFSVKDLKNDRPYLQKSNQATKGALTNTGNAGSLPSGATATHAVLKSLDKIIIANRPAKVKGVFNAIRNLAEAAINNRPSANLHVQVTAKNLVSQLWGCGFSRVNNGASVYYQENGTATTRASDHSASASFFREGNNLSIVIRQPSNYNKFKADKSKNVVEAVFKRDYLTHHPEQIPHILRDIGEFIATGEYHDTAGAMAYNYSGSDTFKAQARDRIYADALARGDIETAQRLLKAAWERNGYTDRREHLDAHGAPSASVKTEDFKNLDALREAVNEDGYDANLWAIAHGISAQPEDYWSDRGPRLYGYNDTAGNEAHAEIARAIRAIQSGAKPLVTVYRAVPKDVKAAQLQSGGEWVSPSRTYAENHGKSRFGEGNYKIIREDVRPEHLWWDANDAREWGYDDGRQYVYANAPGGSKLATVTYDDAGNVIPLSQRFDNTKNDIRFARGGVNVKKPNGVQPSSLGDGKQRYYEVKFDDAVDKIVKNRKPVSDEHVFISGTPSVFRDIGMPALPIMMNQQHVLSCYFGNTDGVKAGNMHGLGERLKSLPRLLAKPMMIIANESNPSSSVVAILKMQDKNGHTVITPVEINGIGRSNGGPITANIAKSAFGKNNLWSEKIAKALRDEVDGKISVFYVDSNEARQISNRLARKAFFFGKSERQLLSVAKGNDA